MTDAPPTLPDLLALVREIVDAREKRHLGRERCAVELLIGTAQAMERRENEKGYPLPPDATRR